MAPSNIEQACAAAIGRAVEAQHQGLPATLTMLMLGSFLFFALNVLACIYLTKRLDERLERARGESQKAIELNQKMLDEHAEYSANVVKALMNPCATVTFTFTPPKQIEQQTLVTPVAATKGKLS